MINVFVSNLCIQGTKQANPQSRPTQKRLVAPTSPLHRINNHQSNIAPPAPNSLIPTFNPQQQSNQSAWADKTTSQSSDYDG